MPREKNSHQSFIVEVSIPGLEDVFNISAFKESRATEKAIDEFVEKHDVDTTLETPKTTVVYQHCNESRADRYFEGYQKGLADRPKEVL